MEGVAHFIKTLPFVPFELSGLLVKSIGLEEVADFVPGVEKVIVLDLRKLFCGQHIWRYK